MAVKVDWGVKRTCQACLAHFYDLNKSPAICPKCHTPYEMIMQGRGRKGRTSLVDDGKNAAIEDLDLDNSGLDLSDDVSDDDLMDDDDLDSNIDGVGDVSDEQDDD